MPAFRDHVATVANLVTIASWLSQNWPAILLFGVLSGIGTVIATGIDYLWQFGWGAFPIVGLLIALLIALVWIAIAHARAKWRGSDSTVLRKGLSMRAEQQGKLERISDKNFFNEVVRLDGKHYIRCVFRNPTFMYDGGPFEASECEVQGVPIVKTSTLELKRFGSLLRGLKLLQKPLLDDDGKPLPAAWNTRPGK